MSVTDHSLLRKPNIFVTGGTGLLGSHLLQHLVSNGQKVAALYRNEIPDFSFSDKIQWIKGDILDPVFIEQTLASFDYVYHSAAIVSFIPSQRESMLQTNVNGTANIVNAALNSGVKKLCYVSSVAALGDGRPLPINENIDYCEQKFGSNYSLSKYLAEKEVWRGIGEGLNTVIVNPTIIIGAGDWNKGSTAIFKSVYESFPWYTEGINGFVDVNDVVMSMITLMNSNISGERFIINGENKSFKEVFTAIANVFGSMPPRKKVNRLIAAIVWRLEALKYTFTGKEPLVTKETVKDALDNNTYDRSKFDHYCKEFVFTPFDETIKRVCNELISKYQLQKV